MDSLKEFETLFEEARKAAVLWAQTGRGYFTMCERVTEYLMEKAKPPKNPNIPALLPEKRRNAACELELKCIPFLSQEQKLKLEEELEDIMNSMSEESERQKLWSWR